MKSIYARDLIKIEQQRRDESLKHVPQSVIDGILQLFKSNPNLNLVRALDAWILRAAAMGYENWCVYQLQLRKTPEIHDVFFDFLEYAIESRNSQFGIPVLLQIDHPTAHRVLLTPLCQGFSKNVATAYWRDDGWMWQREPGNQDHRAKYIATGRLISMVVMLDTTDQGTPEWKPDDWSTEMEASLDCDGTSVLLLYDTPCWWLHAFERSRALLMGFKNGKQTGFPLCFLTESEAEYCFFAGELMRNRLLNEEALR
jgi:hypothetical protein